MKRILLSVGFALMTLAGYAQQDPLYAQYFNNPVLINPAFTGSLERLYAGVAYRSQWAGIEGSPVTYNFNSHVSLVDNRVGLGVMAVQDQLGDIRNTSFGTSYAYRIKMRETTLSFGMQTGFTRYSTSPNGVTLKNPNDPAFTPFATTKFNTGAGLLLQSDRYVISFSVPRLLPGTVRNGGQPIQVYNQNFYLYGSYLFFISDRIEFKPSALFRATSKSKVATDLNANFVFNKLYTAGVFTRQFNTYGILLQLVMNNYRLGYVFEVPGKGSALYYDTHEISLAMSLDVFQFHNHSASGF
jgi:type IX secretion system PorP/SprF family membrane protein